MVNQLGDEVIYRYNSETIRSYIDKIHKEALEEIYHFVELLGLDKDLFKHLEDIDLYLDYTGETGSTPAIASYHCVENAIYFDPRYYNHYIIHNMDDEATRTSIHELTHANRTILIKDPFYSKMYLCDNELMDGNSLYDIFALNYGSYIKEAKGKEILSIEVDDKRYQAKVYDHSIGSFLIYDIEINKISKDDYINQIKEYIKQCHYTTEIKNIEEDIYIASFPKGYFEEQPINFDIDHLNNISELKDDTYYQEEILTCGLEYLINYTKNKDKIDLDSCYKKIKSTKYDVLQYLGVLYLKTIGLDFIKWFMTSCYQDEYRDMTEELFPNHYMDVLSHMAYTYENYKYTKKDEEKLKIKHLEKKLLKLNHKN